MQRAVAAGVDRYGRLDVVVSNAGISGEMVPIVDYPSEVFSRTLAVHVLGAFHVLKHTIPHIADGGSVIITSSVVGLIGPPGASGYVAAKHAQVGLMRTAAKELAARRIRVNTIHPGPTSTGFQDDIEMRATHLPRDEAAKAFDAMIPPAATQPPRRSRTACFTWPPTRARWSHPTGSRSMAA